MLLAHPKQERVDKGIETDGSNLSGVSAKCAWDDLSRPPEDEDDSRSICIGSQPRRLSDKGKGCSGQPRTLLNHNNRYVQYKLWFHWTVLLLCLWLMRICVLFTQTLNRLEKPFGKDWRLIARLCCLPSAVRGTVTIGHSKSCISDTISASGLPPALGGYMVYLMGRPKSGGSRLWSLFQDSTVELANGFFPCHIFWGAYERSFSKSQLFTKTTVGVWCWARTVWRSFWHI